MSQIYNWVCGGSELHEVCFILIGEEHTKIHVEVENNMFSSVNGDFYGIQLTFVWCHIMHIIIM